MRFFVAGVHHVLKGRLARTSGLMFVASAFSGVLGYLYQVLIAKYLSVADFGLASAYIALMGILMVPLGAYGLVLTRVFSSCLGKSAYRYLVDTYYRSWKIVAAVSVITFIVLASFSENLALYLNTGKNSNTVFVFLILICITVLTVPNASLFQGVQKFDWVAINGVVGQIGKLGIGCALIFLGMAVDGVLIGIACTTIFVLFINHFAIRRFFRAIPLTDSEPISSSENIKTILPVLLANFAFVVLSQLDVVLVKSNFTPELAGSYALAAVFGKAVMYLPGAIVVAMYPMVAENEAKNVSSIGLLMQGVFITSVISISGGIFYYLASPLIFSWFYGEKYDPAIQVLQYYSLAMIPMAIIMVMEYFLMAKKRVLFAYLMLAVAPVEVILIEHFNSDLLEVVWVLTGCGWGLVIVGSVVLLMQNKEFAIGLINGGWSK